MLRQNKPERGGDLWPNIHFLNQLITGGEVKYVVDFASELSEIVTETKYMEQLGFSIPELARNVALQVCTFLFLI